MRVVPLPLTEEAVKLLRITHADFSRTYRSQPTVGSTFRGGALGSYDSREVRAQSHYLRLVSIVEAFVDSTSTQIFEARTADLDGFYRLLAADATASAAKGWEDRKSSFGRFHGVSLGQRAGWDVIDGSIQVRNAIAHGLGGLTRQQRNQKTRDKIAKVGVVLRDDRLLIPADALEKCFRACVSFVEDIDPLLPRFRSTL